MNSAIAKLTQNVFPKNARSTSLLRIFTLRNSSEMATRMDLSGHPLCVEYILGSHQCVPDDGPCIEYSVVIVIILRNYEKHSV